MPSVISSLLSAIAFIAVQTSARAVLGQHNYEERATYPFNRLVAFGDELSDNGNGSYAHGITGSPANVYGFGTWTNGPVAVQYLAGLLDVPLVDYAFGGCCGGGSFGATINNAYTPAAAKWNGKPVPSIHDQVRLNYTKPAPPSIKSSLQFIWTGENDLSAHTDAFWEGDPKNADFSSEMARRITSNAEYLVNKGAPYVFVANIYPKHKAPVTTTYLCPDGGCIDTWGNIIQSANTAIKTSLSKSKYSSKFIYYDVFGFMMQVMANKDKYGLTESLASYCDGDASDPNEKWDTCIAGSYVWEGAEKFYWMNYIQPTAHVHRLIAADMKATIDRFFR
jgi:phospholipase/lecithinase/hemolysin